jgi:serine/threonine protein kinase/Tfp pilus assembly protein PilF
MIGQTLGQYRILEKLGAGGMGEVYRARDERLKRDVALKILSAAAPGDPGTEKKLLREAQAASALNDPHICTIYEVGEANGQAFIAMELVEGRPLSGVIPPEGLPPNLIVRYGAQIAGALAHAHDRGIIHRDVKTSNVIITSSGQVKVLDFGLAKRQSGKDFEEATRSVQSTAKASRIVGTLPCMAPEILRGEEADARSDVWALGIALYEMASGAKPFRGQTGYELSSAILREPAPVLPAQITAGLRTVIERCLEKEPGQRYQRAGEVRAALEALQTETENRASTRSGTRVTRQRQIAWTAASLTALIVGLLVALNVGGLRKRLGPAAERRIQSIAVLPLENFSHDSEQQYFVDAFTEELTTDLAKIRNLRVISRTSAMRYRGSAKAIPEIAKELGVDAVLEGSVERVGGRVRINAQLIYAPTDTHVWAEKYDRDLEDVLALQDEVATAISHEIQVQLDPSEVERLARHRQIKPAAYEYYSKGRFYLNIEESAEDAQKALEYFRKAIEVEPGYAEAYAGVADAYILLGEPEFSPGLTPQESLGEAKTAALKAIQLDDTISESHFSLARVLEMREWDWKGAEKEFKRAVELSPSNAITRQWYAEYLQALGRNDEALAEMKRGLSLDPLSESIAQDLGLVYWSVRRYDEALEQFRSINNSWGLCWVYREQKRYAEAIVECQRFAQSGSKQLSLASLAGIYALSGDRPQANRALAELDRYSKEHYVSPYVRALAEHEFGRKDRAFAILEEGIRIHDQWMVWLKVDPGWDGLRSDPRYADLIRRIGFPQ